LLCLAEDHDIILFKRASREYSDEIVETASEIYESPSYGGMYLDYAIYYIYVTIVCLYLSYKNRVGAVHTFPGPISHLGFLSQQLFGVTWVADILDDPAVELEALENCKPYLKYIIYTLHVKLMYRTLPSADHVLIVGMSTEKGLAKYIINKYSINPDDVCATPNGVDVDATIRECNRSDESFTIFYVGSMQSIRGLNILIKSVGTLAETVDDIQLKLLGPVRRKQDYQEIRELLISSQIIEITDFSGERVQHSRVLDQMCKADVCVLPLSPKIGNFKYTYPVKLFEYIAMGRPVVASNLPGIAEIIQHEKNGLLVPPDDEDAFASALQRLYNDEDLRDHLGTEAKKRADDFDWARIGRKVRDQYPTR
jgi:glycosyltransferase involved in cell wall biosynthesis